MCSGDRLVADFMADAGARPDVPEELQPHLTVTADGQWVVWAHKLARLRGAVFEPLTGGPGYPADATAECRRRPGRGGHRPPEPGCTCGFHALSDPNLPRLPPRRGLTPLTVALSGRVLAFEWHGAGVLWRAERQTVVRTGRAGRLDLAGELPARRHPGDPDGLLAAVAGA